MVGGKHSWVVCCDTLWHGCVGLGEEKRRKREGEERGRRRRGKGREKEKRGRGERRGADPLVLFWGWSNNPEAPGPGSGTNG